MNNKGMAQVYLILILPIVFTLLFSGMWMVWFMNQRNRIENLCHESLLRSQEILVEGNTNLLSYNMEAYSLIIAKRILKKLMKSPNPWVVLAASAGYVTVKAEQKRVAGIQQSIITQMNSRSQTSVYDFRRNFYHKIQDMASLWKTTEYRAPELHIYPKQSQVKIRIKDIASVYKRPVHHKAAQTMKAEWRIPLSNFFPRWLQSYFTGQNQWVGECASHPTNKGGLTWYPVIGEASLW